MANSPKMTMKVMKEFEWLDRVLIISPVLYALCLTQEAFTKELKRLKIKVSQEDSLFLIKGARATTHTFAMDNDAVVCIVCMPIDLALSEVEVYATLTHEAVHVWQEIKQVLGEEKPGIEQEAYSIESIAYRLMHSYYKNNKKLKGKG
jgi:hypothetical protein